MKNLVYNIHENEFNETTGEYPVLGQGVFKNKKEFIEGLKQLNLYKDNLVCQLVKSDSKYKKLTGM